MTVNVTLSCAGVGFAAGLGTLPTQTRALTITKPTSVAPNANYTVTADLAALALRRPNGIDLNAFNIQGVISQTANSGTLGNAGGTPTAFTDTGPLDPVTNSYPANGKIPATASAAGTSGAAGTITVTIGTVSIITGSTGFLCTVVGAAPTYTITVA